MPAQIRNVAIIAHVDHGKTTLVDGLLRQARVFREGQAVQERAMDWDELERERGITILAKNTALTWQGVRINIIDTPGHADFGGEVERVLSMADGALLLVDAFEGVMPQTRFVLRKAFAARLKPLVVVNKMDRPEARPQAVREEILSLFIDLGAGEEALETPIVYASAREGWAAMAWDRPGRDLTALFGAILEHVPPPPDDPALPLRFRVSTLDWSDYVGRIAIGRVHAGILRLGARVAHIAADGSRREAEVKGLYRFEGLRRIEATELGAGDIGAVFGLDEIAIGDSLVDPSQGVALPVIAIDPPTVAMTFRVNASPLAGREGRYVTSRHLRDRLHREVRTNLALKVDQAGSPDTFAVKGRGILHLGILVERMRREGYEFAVGQPRVITREEGGRLLEPIEHLVVECPDGLSGRVMELAGSRRGELLRMERRGMLLHLEFTIPARGLVGFRTRLLNLTAGEAVLYHTFLEYGPHRGPIPGRTAGVLIAAGPGEATAYALDQLRSRGIFFVRPGDQIYEGMVVGEHCKEDDVVVNICRQKKLTNVRSSNKEMVDKLSPPRLFGVEEALEYVGPEELVEITPGSIRLRKILLAAKDRKRVESA